MTLIQVSLVLAAVLLLVVGLFGLTSRDGGGGGGGGGVPNPGPAQGGDQPRTFSLDDEDPAFPTLPVGSRLPSDDECTQRVHDANIDYEAKPENDQANHGTPGVFTLPPWPDFWAPQVNDTIVPRISGNFMGSTNEILTWGACKWGIDANLVRAMAVSETGWKQSFTGDPSNNPADCVDGATPPCPTSFGLLQLKTTTRPGSYPWSQQYTAFNVDYSLAVLRGCYEGYVTYLRDGYKAGDMWGCAGWHFSGRWMDAGAQQYIKRTQDHYRHREWLQW